MIKSEHLRSIAGAYLAGRGYLVEIVPEIPGSPHTPDFIAVRPLQREVRLRLDRGAAPVGILHHLVKSGPLTGEEIISRTGFEPGFVMAVLHDAAEAGWVIKRQVADGGITWDIGDYRVPASECLALTCGQDDALQALQVLEELKGCCHRGYLAFPYETDGSFLKTCRSRGMGVMSYRPQSCDFIVQLPAARRRITKYNVYASICEKVVADHIARNPYLHR